MFIIFNSNEFPIEVSMDEAEAKRIADEVKGYYIYSA